MEYSQESFRRAASEGSLSLMVTVSFNDEWIQRGGGEGGEHERAGKGGGGGPRRFSGQDIRRGSGGSKFEGGRGGGIGVGAKGETK